MNMKLVDISNIAQAITDHGVEILTQTRIGYMQECFKKHWFRYEMRLVPQTEKEKTLSFGSLIHECLEEWHKPGSAGEAQTTNERSITVFALINVTYPDRSTDEKAKELWHYAIAMMRAYIARYPCGSENFQTIHTEHGAVGPILNPKTDAAARAVVYALKADGIVQMFFDGSYWLFEYKTKSGSVENAYLDKLWNDFQIVSYSYYLERQENIKISGVVYNVLVKPRLKQKIEETEEAFQIRYAAACEKNKSGKSSATRELGETDDEFQARLAVYYADPEKLHREEILIDKRQYDEVRTELWQLAQLYLFLRRSKSWPRNRKACFNWGRRCGYYEVCNAQPHEEEEMTRIFLKHEAPHRELAEMLGLKVDDVKDTDTLVNPEPGPATHTINDDAAILREQMKSGPDAQVDFWGDF